MLHLCLSTVEGLHDVVRRGYSCHQMLPVDWQLWLLVVVGEKLSVDLAVMMEDWT